MTRCFTNRPLLAVGLVLPASQPFEMIIPFVSLSAFCRHGGLIIVILLFYLFSVCVRVCVCSTARRTEESICWRMDCLISTARECYQTGSSQNQFYFCAVGKKKQQICDQCGLEVDTHAGVKVQTGREFHTKSGGLVKPDKLLYCISQERNHLIFYLCNTVFISMRTVS